MKRVRKAVIPAAGLGTRFLPATKSIPKEMLPVVDRPTLLYVVEEAVAAGIEDIIIIAGRGKSAIEDFFDISYELEDQLSKSNKIELLDEIKKVRDLANIISIRQKSALGLGHAVYCAKPIVGDEPFAVLLGDEITFRPGADHCVTGVLAKIYEESGISTVNVMTVEDCDVSKYGIVAHDKINQSGPFSCYNIIDVIEKPDLESAPSNLALPGRYVFDPKIFSELERVKPGRNNEIQLTDGMTLLAKSLGLTGVEVPSDRFDTGDKIGFIKANVEFGLMRPEMKTKLIIELENLIKKYQGA